MMGSTKGGANGAAGGGATQPKSLAKSEGPSTTSAAPMPPPRPAAAAAAPRAVYSHPALAKHLARKVAVDADCEERAVFKYLAGLAQHPLMRERIERALVKNGHPDLVGYATRTKANAAINARINGKG